MKTNTSDMIDELMLAEASAWLTRLQDTARTQATEAAFREWLSASPSHARAFTRINDVWELLPVAVAPAACSPQMARVRRHRTRTRHTPWVVASACAALALLTVGVVRMLLPVEQTYQTAAGVQKTIVLADRTQITLNTDTKIAVAYRQGERRVLLERGEALFHVAKNPQRPFVVQTGDAQVVDLGTVFDVRHYSGSVAVTLVEGSVWVGTRRMPSTVLVPGERLTIHANGTHALDQPNIQQALAWQQGQAYFDNTTLADAATELNRYGDTPIRIADPALASLRVSGVFSVRDPAEFASAVASLHDLHAERKGGVIVLER